MRRALVLIGIVVGLTSWLSAAPAAGRPAPACEFVNGKPCSPTGQTTPCWDSIGGNVLCWCYNNGGQTVWMCPMPA